MSLAEYKILPLTDEARNYLVNIRKLDESVLRLFSVGTNGRGEIALPFYNDDNQLVGVKLRSPNGGLLERKRQDEDTEEWTNYSVKTDSVKGSKPILLGTHTITDFQTLHICYGDYDAMSLRCIGLQAVSLPFGDRGTNWIEKQWDWLQRFQQIVFCPDYDDNPKTQAMLMMKLQEMSKRLGKHRCFLIPEKAMMACKDINELWVEHGKEFLNRAVIQAIPVPEPGLSRLADYADPEFIEGTPLGIEEIDRATGGHAGGGLTIIAGDNNAGKTTTIINMMINFKFEGDRSFYWSGEQKPDKVRWWLEQVIAGPDYLESFEGKKSKRVYHKAASKYIDAIRAWYYDDIYVYDKRGIDAEQFFEVAELAVRRYDVTKIFIDNLMAFTSDDDDEYGAQKAFIESCKNFAEDWDVHVFVVAHNKKEKKYEQTKPEVIQQTIELPDKDSVLGAKAITNWADFVIQIVRITDKNRIEKLGNCSAIWSLCKNRETEDLVDVRMHFDKDSKRIVQYTMADTMTKRKFGWEPENEYQVNY